jgi:energy-coupling factor transport system ATP-binding protein
MNISFEEVSFSYPSGVAALREVNLTVGSGDAVALVGENGAGKTTLAKLLNGLLMPQNGRVLVGEWDTRQRTTAQLARRIGYVFQNPDEQLFERTVWAEVAFGPRNLGCAEAEVRASVDAALTQVGLEAKAKHHPYDLHASQRKLVALAAMLAMKTPVIILDEPTTGQDARGIALIGEIVETLKAKGCTVLAISHDVDFCADHFERVVVMSQGRILAEGPTRRIFSGTDLLAQANVEPPQLVRLAVQLGLAATPRSVDDFIAILIGRTLENDKNGG